MRAACKVVKLGRFQLEKLDINIHIALVSLEQQATVLRAWASHEARYFDKLIIEMCQQTVFKYFVLVFIFTRRPRVQPKSPRDEIIS